MEITHKNQGELDSTMLPFVMRELVELVMKKGIAFRRCTVLYIFFQVV